MDHKEVVNQHITLRNKSSLSLLDISVRTWYGIHNPLKVRNWISSFEFDYFSQTGT